VLGKGSFGKAFLVTCGSDGVSYLLFLVQSEGTSYPTVARFSGTLFSFEPKTEK